MGRSKRLMCSFEVFRWILRGYGGIVLVKLV